MGAVGYFVAVRKISPYQERAETYDLSLIDRVEEPSIILGRDGGEIGRIFVQNRSVISIDDVPTVFIDALRAGEDKRFYDHDGVDRIGVVRAAIDYVKYREAVSGASTITQQLARGAYDLEADRRKRGESGVERKMVEAFLAMRIEKRFSKREILQFYLNRIYFGSGFYGVRSAALGYFGKEPKELSKVESATLVGLIKNPTGLSPLNNPKASQVARNMVIDRMMSNLQVISESEAAKMKNEPVKVNPKPLQRGTSHVYERIADEIRHLLGEEALAAGGFTIHTTIDSVVQRAAEKALEKSLLKAEGHPGYAHPRHADYRHSPESDAAPEYLQGAVLMIDHRTGGVIAHVGGRDYAEAPFDFIELGERPLGTGFFPFIYAAALENGATPATQVDDEAMDNRAVMIGGREGILGEWGSETTSPRYEGKITLRRALERSKVAATVRIANEVGLEKVAQQASAFGLEMDDAALLPRLAVGWEPVSLKSAVKAYASFARGGRVATSNLFYVQSVRTKAGSIRFERPIINADGETAISDASAFQIHNIMQDGMAGGSADGLLEMLTERPFNGAGRPGTTHDFSDNWFLGYDGRVACGVWIGYLQPGKTIYEGAFARNFAMPVWAATLNAAATDFGGKGISQPESILEIEVCRVSGQQATPYCYEMVQDSSTGEMKSRSAATPEFFQKGTEKIPFCTVHSGSAPIDPNGSVLDLDQLVVIDTSPVRPSSPTLIGADPYHSVTVSADTAIPARIRTRRTNVLDSFDINDAENGIDLPKPSRLEISPE